ncbi:MAG: hypothetical protein ACRCX8_02625 [Sarcina sp.]
MLKIYRVYRNPSKTPGWWCEYGFQEVLIVAKNEAQAKGLAMKEVHSLRAEVADEHRLLNKKDIFVEEVDLEFGKILMKS